jgi:DNA-binding response OmpR family regulator
LLIVDDEAHIRSGLSRALGLMGYTVEEAGSGQEALILLGRRTYDLMILDLRMPGLGGKEVITLVHDVAPGMPIIVLTGHATLDSAIAAARSEEVVDYLLKPVGVHDMASAVALALQRQQRRRAQERLVQAISEVIDELHELDRPPSGSGKRRTVTESRSATGTLRLDLEKRLVIRADQPAEPVALTASEMAALELLMNHPGQVISCREMAREAWGYNISEGEAQGLVRSTIFRLRHKLEADPSSPSLIRNVRGRGYFYAAAEE